MRRFAHIAAVSAAAALAACAHGPAAPIGSPDYAPIAGSPPNARARLYADCVAQAAAAGRFVQASDPDTRLILFTCTGPVARAFFEALGPWSAAKGSEFISAGRTWRSTAKVKANLFGVDHCSTDGTGDHQCVITLNTGDFAGDGQVE